jgi:putative colanic acid biosysnthesis UDP-glucose lipid carrier transferase
MHRTRGGNIREILYWGYSVAAFKFNTNLLNAPWLGIRMIKWFCPNLPRPDYQHEGLPPSSGGLSEMRRWLSTNDVDSIIFSHLPSSNVNIIELMEFFGDTCLQ